MSGQSRDREQSEGKSGGETGGAQRGSDPLSTFLLAAALVLGGMYAYEKWQERRVDRQAERAERIAESFAVDGFDCQSGAAGLKGEEMVFSCRGLEAEKLAAAVAEIDDLAGRLDSFDRAVFRGTDSQLVCAAEPRDWPDRCDEESVPDVRRRGKDG